MKDFFTHKQKNAREDRIYYFEKYKDLYCKARRTYHAVRHEVSWTDKDGCTYKTKRVKGGPLAELFCNYNSYIWLRFDILKEDREKNTLETVGTVSFPKAGHICLAAENNEFCIQGHSEGYYSLKKNGKQAALFFQEPFAKCGYYRYCVWYEPECKDYMGYFMLLLTMTDYIFYSDSSGTGKEKYNVYYSKKAEAEEIYWRPSDTDETASKGEEEKYFEKTEKQKKHGQIFMVYFLIFFFIALAFICFCCLHG